MKEKKMYLLLGFGLESNDIVKDENEYIYTFSLPTIDFKFNDKFKNSTNQLTLIDGDLIKPNLLEIIADYSLLHYDIIKEEYVDCICIYSNEHPIIKLSSDYNNLNMQLKEFNNSHYHMVENLDLFESLCFNYDKPIIKFKIPHSVLYDLGTEYRTQLKNDF